MSNPLKKLNIAIIGAGLGGLTAALYLVRQGFSVRVYEQAHELGEVGAGITIAPNATMALNAVGLADALASVATQVRKQGVLHYKDGRILVENDRGDIPLQRYGAHYYQLHRADLHQIMVEALHTLDSNAVILNHQLENFEETADQVSMTFTNGAISTADLMIGCDGIHSVVRNKILGDEELLFTRRIAWRGLVPAAEFPDFFELFALSSSGFIGPDRNLGVYPVRHGEFINYAALCVSDDWTEESWNIPSMPEELMAEFAGWYQPVLDLFAATPRNQLFKWGLFDREPATSWTQGRVTLLGDAAHPMLPYLGQGTAIALEDAVVLGRCLTEFSSDYRKAFQHYEFARMERAALCQLESRAKGERWVSSDPESYDKSTHKNEETLGLFEYDPAATPI